MNDIRKIEDGLLKKTYPAVRKYVGEDEILLACSPRRRSLLSGGSCLLAGAFMAEQGVAGLLFYHMPGTVWMALAATAGICAGWAGWWFCFMAGREFVFVTDKRLAWHRVDLLGRSSGICYEAELINIQALHFFKDAALFRDAVTGVISVRERGKRGERLLPNLKNAASVYAELSQMVFETRIAEKNEEKSCQKG
ncbi:MAG: hypothetical protein K2O06_13145 [Acetatifactor sp.]|nr:hypothetical protein [Acetatifactor sp.]